MINKMENLIKQRELDEIVGAKPKDYRDRNRFYKIIAEVLSYPLQSLSVFAGGYLLFDIARFVWQFEMNSFSGGFLMLGCFLIFLSIESYRRWLVNTTGYHYLATFSYNGKEINPGEWLRTKVVILMFISVVLISSGVYGAYLYILHSAPKAQVIDVQSVTSPLSDKIQFERKSIERIDKDVQSIVHSKKTELNDVRSYSTWQGREYLLPEVKERHSNYDKQIAEMNRQRISHQAQLSSLENSLSGKEKETEVKNNHFFSINKTDKELYAMSCAGIWLGFEALILFTLAYPWVYKYQIKKEFVFSKPEPKEPEKKKNPSPTLPDDLTKLERDIVDRNLKKGIPLVHIMSNLRPNRDNKIYEPEIEEIENVQNPIGFQYDKKPDLNVQSKSNERTKDRTFAEMNVQNGIDKLNAIKKDVLNSKWKCTETELYEMYKSGKIKTVSEGVEVSGMSRGKVNQIQKKAIG